MIDLAGRRKIGDLMVGGSPEGITLSPDGRILWVADLEGARVRAFDTSQVGETAPAKSAPFSTKPLAVVGTGQRPIRVIASPDGRWIVTSNHGDGTLTVIDARTRTAARTVPVSGAGEAEQVTIIFSPDGRRIYAAETRRNQVAEIDFVTGRVLRRLTAGAQGDGLALAETAE